MSQVIYARVPDEVKEAADAFAGERGTTLTSAIADLLERGLESVVNEGSIKELQDSVTRLSNENSQLEAGMQKATAELGTLRALAQRTEQRVGSCPNPGCGQSISGYDLLATGACPKCHYVLTGLLTPSSTPTPKGQPNVQVGGLNERDFLVLLGAVGAVVGAAYLTSKS